MPSPEAAQVFQMNQQLLADWTADPEATVDDMREVFERFLAQIRPTDDATFEDVDANGVPAIWVDTPGAAADRVVIHYHSGGYVMGSAEGYRGFGAHLSAATGARVLLVDYRLAPEHPFPAGAEDGMASYEYVVGTGVSPSNIVISGDSGGGGLALVLMHDLRDRGGEQPAAGVFLSPLADMTLTGESMQTNAANDPLLPGEGLLGVLVPMILGEHGRREDPRISPVFADYTGLPPLLFFAGSIEALRDDAVRCAQAAKDAGVDAEMVIGEDMVHIWPTYADRLPEAREALEKIGAFVKQHVGAGATA